MIVSTEMPDRLGDCSPDGQPSRRHQERRVLTSSPCRLPGAVDRQIAMSISARLRQPAASAHSRRARSQPEISGRSRRRRTSDNTKLTAGSPPTSQ